MIEQFLTSLQFDGDLPNGIEVLDPYANTETCRVVHEMVKRYYQDGHPRLGVWGINPGRFGAGITGLSFTDPWAVSNLLGINTTLTGRRELSAEFISMVIERYGGPTVFYRDVYMCALSPLGFVKNGKNINFYDHPKLIRSIVPFVLSSLRAQHKAGLIADRCIVLGAGKLKSFTEREVSGAMGYTKILYLEHPRYIMQYRRADVSMFVDKYIEAIREILNPF
ncbi:MAG: DUF4918 family protein [Candidatus Kapabacteria bacterium]|nr:DUF4918 family protein [Candidatus Kapabacteria bacterium]